MKEAICLGILLAIAAPVLGAANVYDPANYTPNESLGCTDPTIPPPVTCKTAPTGQTWYLGTNGPSVIQDAVIYEENLSIAGLAPSCCRSIQLQGLAASNGVVDRISPGAGAPYTTGTLYYSFILRVYDLTGGGGTPASQNGGFVAGFNNSAPSPTSNNLTRAAARLFLGVHPDNPSAFRIGIRRDSGTVTDTQYDTQQFLPVASDANAPPIFIVVAYTLNNGSTTDDVHSLWINPPSSSFAAAVAPAPTNADTGADISQGQVQSFILRQADVGPYLTVVDEVRVGTSWADVTPIGCNDPRFDVEPAPAGDDDVDLSDFSELQLCYSLSSSTAGCKCFDKDGSGTIDGTDVVAFMDCAAAGDPLYRDQVPANPSCDD